MFGPLFPKSRKPWKPVAWMPSCVEQEVAALEEKVARAHVPWVERKRSFEIVRPSGDVEVFTGYTEARPGEGGALEFWSPYQRELILHSSQWISVRVVNDEP